MGRAERRDRDVHQSRIRTREFLGPFPHAALEIIQRDAVTIFEGVPTMYAAMLHTPDGGPARG